MTYRALTLSLLFVPCVLLYACESNPQPKAAPTGAEASAPDTEVNAPVALEETEPAIEVSAKGTTFDPPIEVEQVPEGAYYCDMGTVHYARTEKGDGTCALCGMALKHKVKSSASGKAIHEEHGDHVHDEHENCDHAECNHDH